MQRDRLYFASFPALLVSLTVLLLGARLQADTLEPAQIDPSGINVTFVYTGEIPIDLWTNGEEGELVDAGVQLNAGESIPFTGAQPGDKVAAVQADVPGADPYYVLTFSEKAVGPEIEIPDPRHDQSVVLIIENDLDRVVRVFKALPAQAAAHPDAEPPSLFEELADIASDETGEVQVNPQDDVVVATLDSSFRLHRPVGFDAEQRLQLSSFLAPDAELIELEIINLSEVSIQVDEVRDTSVLRIALVESGIQSVIRAAIGSELDLITADESRFRLEPYVVTDAEDQAIVIDHEDEIEQVSLSKQTDLSILPEDIAESAVGFIQNLAPAMQSRPDIAGFIAYNSGTEPSTYFLVETDDSVAGLRTVQPGNFMRVITRVGHKIFVVPGAIEIDGIGDLSADDILSITEISQEMNQVLDIGVPRRVDVTLHNRACKPAEIFSLDAYGQPRFVQSMAPLAEPQTVNLYSGSQLYAVAGKPSAVAGSRFWQGMVDEDATDVEINYAGEAVDDLSEAKLDPDDTTLRTVQIRNDSSRAIDVLKFDEFGSKRPMENGRIDKATTAVFRFAPGELLIFERPDAPTAASEYGRYRVTKARNASFDVSSLRRTAGFSGIWIETPRPATESNQNLVGAVKYLTIVDQGDGTIQGSLSAGDRMDGAPAYFEGCADAVDAFGNWGSRYGQQWVCGKSGSTWRDSNGVAYRGYGGFNAQRKDDGSIQLARDWCYGGTDPGQRWYPLPQHFSDMDPSTEPFRSGEFDGSNWAPKNFSWLGRGYDLLRTDPLNFGDTSAGIVSANPLFSFFYEDADGRAVQAVTKKIFGVSPLNEQGLSTRCEGESTLIKSYEQLHDFSAQSYGASVGVPGIASFSLSKSHEEARDSGLGSEHMYVLDHCQVSGPEYQLDLRWADGADYFRQLLDPAFRQAIEQMSIAEEDRDEIDNIIEAFGTHYSERIVYGGRFFARTTVDKYTYQAASEEKDGLSIEASGTIKKVSIGGSYKNETGSGRTDENSIEGTSYEKWGIGGELSDVYSEWVKTVKGEPMPIDVTFRPIFELLSPIFFPNDPNIGIKQHLFRKATLDYFAEHGVVEFTSDPEQLNVVEPRYVCVELDALTITRLVPLPSDYYGGRLEAWFTDHAGNPIPNATPIPVAFNNGNENGWGIDYWVEGGKFPFHRFPSYSGFRACGPELSETWGRNGHIYLFGHIDINGSMGVTLPRNFPKAHMFSLRDVKAGAPTSFTGDLQIGGDNAKYRLTVWEFGTVPNLDKDG